jgi:hypothetical protein
MLPMLLGGWMRLMADILRTGGRFDKRIFNER